MEDHYTCPKCKENSADLYGSCSNCGISEEAKREIAVQKADEVMTYITKDENLCLIRWLLEGYFSGLFLSDIEIVESIEAVVSYCWDVEESHFEETPEDQRVCHKENP